jgi:cytochrome c-type biogenesis protein CcmH/NrfG
VDECRAALRLDPFETRTRLLLIDCLIHQGEKKQAQGEFETLLVLHPQERDRLQRWFDELARPGK